MPEYLAPGVYVEEIDTGSKPIEGVSTSTAGVVGITERGPANVPILVTSFGDFCRSFGGYLSIRYSCGEIPTWSPSRKRFIAACIVCDPRRASTGHRCVAPQTS